MYKVFPVTGGFQIFWCPNWQSGKTKAEKMADAKPYDGYIYPPNPGSGKSTAAYRRCKQLNDAVKEVDKMIAKDGAIIL